MFLFLSKLLPLLIYPAGLVCVLLVIALGVWWKQPYLAQRLIIGVLTILLIGGNAWFAEAVVRSLEYQNLPTQLPTAEAIVLLGGAIRPKTSPRPMFELNEAGDRILYAAKLYRDGKAPLIVASGGRITWRESGRPESTDMVDLLSTLGVPNSAVIEDPSSLNTYENAVNVKKILDARRIRRILLVTSAIHMPRSLLIFKKLGIEAIAAPTDFLAVEPAPGELQLEAIILKLFPEAENLDRLTRALKEYIGIAVYRLKRVVVKTGQPGH